MNPLLSLKNIISENLSQIVQELLLIKEIVHLPMLLQVRLLSLIDYANKLKEKLMYN